MIRCLSETETYRACCEQLDSDAPRLDEALRFPLFAIAERPESFPEIPKTNLRRAKTNRFPGAPSMVIYFRVTEDDTTCELLWIERSPDDNDPSEQLVDEADEAA